MIYLILFFILFVKSEYKNCGENCDWKIENETLIIYGSGKIYDYFDSNPPFFDYQENFTKIKIEEGITSIGNYSFSELDNIIEVEFGNTIKTIGDEAFSNCISLETIIMPDSVETIGKKNFFIMYFIKNSKIIK